MRELQRPWHFVVTATTRPRRRGERNGVDYTFLTREEFARMIVEDEFLEHAEVYGHYYGVPKDQVRSALARGQDVILKVDVQGAATIKKLVAEAVFIFMAPPSLEELERRLRERHTEGPDYLNARLSKAQQEMACTSMFDYLVVNETQRLDDLVACIDAIIVAEKCRFPPRRIVV